MTMYQEAQRATEQTRLPVHTPFRQSTTWDQAQGVPGVAGRPTVFDQQLGHNLNAQMAARRDLSSQLRRIQQHYMIVDSDRDVIHLLNKHPMLYVLLLDAVRPLKLTFGARLCYIRVQHADYDCLLKVAVQLPAEYAEPEAALHAFDKNWWINNCQRSSGALVFDYEIQDAV